jgi:hypothetical protein
VLSRSSIAIKMCVGFGKRVSCRSFKKRLGLRRLGEDGILMFSDPITEFECNPEKHTVKSIS